ncbi:MAG TPA: DEAD/DEAH box helicase, partial [Solirubrobacteraceae bacterium]|nr:DEAD/DEAH box helicase [Solirubrobacteraceae bacterium]
MPLSSFSPRTRRWFERAFAGPTPAQAQAWPAIAAGEHVLLSAPTGSGKTLAAFLWALDRLSTQEAPGAGTRVVYVSPLKALAYDIERNLRAPLRGIAGEQAAGVAGGRAAGDELAAGEGERAAGKGERAAGEGGRAGGGAREVRVGIRTGDTPQRERAAMVRNPPDILVTTPESLYLILTSQARAMLTGVEAVIVDEIHAVAATKRGAHLALTLERLERQAGWAGGKSIQRIGLSATQSPLEEIGRFLVGPHRQVTILDAGVRKRLDLRIEVPVESMSEPAAPADADPLEPVQGGESTRASIWPAIYPELLALVRRHSSTIVFVNNRRSAERVALRLN